MVSIFGATSVVKSGVLGSHFLVRLVTTRRNKCCKQVGTQSREFGPKSDFGLLEFKYLNGPKKLNLHIFPNIYK